jgi:hypothetical protein
MTTARAAFFLTALAALSGCLERRMTITSDPPGATVTVNDTEIGRTPVTASFVNYGVYDVQLDREGSEPLRTKARAGAPIYEWPPIDLVSTVIPATISTDIHWHFKLQPELSTTQSRDDLHRDLLDRAANLRKQVN